MPTDRIFPPLRYARPDHPILDPRVTQAFIDAPGSSYQPVVPELPPEVRVLLHRALERTPVLAFDGTAWRRGEELDYPAALCAHAGIVRALSGVMLRSLTPGQVAALRGALALTAGASLLRRALDLRPITRAMVGEFLAGLAAVAPPPTPTGYGGDGLLRLCDGWALDTTGDTEALAFAWSEVFAAMGGADAKHLQGATATAAWRGRHRRYAEAHGELRLVWDDGGDDAVWNALFGRGWGTSAHVRAPRCTAPGEGALRVHRQQKQEDAKVGWVTQSPGALRHDMNDTAPPGDSPVADTHEAAQDAAWYAWRLRE